MQTIRMEKVDKADHKHGEEHLSGQDQIYSMNSLAGIAADMTYIIMTVQWNIAQEIRPQIPREKTFSYINYYLTKEYSFKKTFQNIAY